MCRKHCQGLFDWENVPNKKGIQVYGAGADGKMGCNNFGIPYEKAHKDEIRAALRLFPEHS